MANEVTTTATLSSLMRDELEAAQMAVQAPTLFWPGAPLHNQLRIMDLSNRPGLTGQFNTYGALTAADVTEGVDYTTISDITNTPVDIAATSHQVVTWISDELLASVSNPWDAQMLLRDQAKMHQAAHEKALDVAILHQFSHVTEGAASSGAACTVDGLLTAIGKARAANIMDPVVGLLSPVHWSDIVADASAPALTLVANEVYNDILRNYQTQRLLGVDWFISSNVYDDGTDAFSGFISPRCIGLTWKKAPSVTMFYDQSRRATEVSTVSTWGVGVVEATQGYYLKYGKS